MTANRELDAGFTASHYRTGFSSSSVGADGGER
jgi:hypothetical protein